MESLKDLIPEAYYDVVARLGPGVIATLSLWQRWHSSISALAPVNTVLIAGSALAVAYTLGMILDVLGSLMIGSLSRWVRSGIRRVRPSLASDVDPWKIMRQLRSSRGSGILGKMLAERTLLRSLAVLVALWELGDLGPLATLDASISWTLVLILSVAQFHWQTLAALTAVTLRDAASLAASSPDAARVSKPPPTLADSARFEGEVRSSTTPSG